MSRRWYFETAPSVKGQVISVKRTRSHRHRHQHRRHHDPDVYRVSRGEWSHFVERERCLAESNRGLADEANGLRASLSAAQADVHHFSQVVVPQMQGQVNALSADNAALRLYLDKVVKQSCEDERLRQIIYKLEKDKCCLEREIAELKNAKASLRERVRCPSKPIDVGCDRRPPDLSREAEYWKDQCSQWRSRFKETRRRHDDTCGLLEIRTQKMRAYEEILKRRRII